MINIVAISHTSQLMAQEFEKPRTWIHVTQLMKPEWKLCVVV